MALAPTPPIPRGRKAEQSDRTRAALLTVARSLFAERGYAGAATEEVVQQAGVTRGALYHHFRDKQDLFEAVFVEVQEEVRAGIRAASQAQPDAWSAFRAGFGEYLNRSMDPAVQGILFRDAPVVLGWQRWREVDVCLVMIQNGLGALVRAGVVSPSFPVDEFAHLLRGVASEAAHMIASAPDAAAERRRTGEAVDQILEGIRGR